jgi:hypothetical protein
MYSEKKLRKAPLDTPLLFTFRRHVQKGSLQGIYQDRMVATIQIPFHGISGAAGTPLEVVAIENLNAGYSSRASFWFNRGPDTKGYAILNPLYLQTIEEFPYRDLPLLLGWFRQYPGLAKLLHCEASNGLSETGIQEG